MRTRGTTAESAAAYRHCQAIAAAHGRTYYLATRLLSPPRRTAVHALYAFARTVDDIVDYAEDLVDRAGDRGAAGRRRASAAGARPVIHGVPTGAVTVASRAVGPVPGAVAVGSGAGAVTAVGRGAPAAGAVGVLDALPGPAPVRARLDAIEQQVRDAFAGVPGSSRCGADDCSGAVAETGSGIRTVPARHAVSDPVLTALADTVARYRIAPEHFWAFLHAMRMDVPGGPEFRDRYADMAQLREYMHGSAAVIGLQLLPVLGTVVPIAEAEPAAAALGEAFQLTNFLRDVAEDLDRGRIYLPADELAAFGVDEELLAYCRRTGRTDARVRRALAHLIATNRALYRSADAGIGLLQPRVRPAIRTAAVLYADILTEIERSGYAVFDRRARVPRRRRLLVAAAQACSELRRA